jgi:hypothetical protein
VVFALEGLFNSSVVNAQPGLVTLEGNLTLPLPVVYASNGSSARRRLANLECRSGPDAQHRFQVSFQT